MGTAAIVALAAAISSCSLLFAFAFAFFLYRIKCIDLCSRAATNATTSIGRRAVIARVALSAAAVCMLLAGRDTFLDQASSEGCENVRVVFSIPIYECLGCARRQYANVLRLNQGGAIVTHLNARMTESRSELAIFAAEIRRRHGCRLCVNPQRLAVFWKGPTSACWQRV